MNKLFRIKLYSVRWLHSNEWSVFLRLQDDEADGEDDGDDELKRAQKDGIGEMFAVREDQVREQLHPRSVVLVHLSHGWLMT